jgi:hypothetical protein
MLIGPAQFAAMIAAVDVSSPKPLTLKQFTVLTVEGSVPFIAFTLDFQVDCVPEPSWAENTKIGAEVEPSWLQLLINPFQMPWTSGVESRSLGMLEGVDARATDE